MLWELIPFALVWSLWLDRNNLLFQNTTFNSEVIWDLHLMRILWWIQAWWPSCPFSSYDFEQHFDKLGLPIKPDPIERNIEWQPPEGFMLKFNVGDSSQGNPGPSGIGGAIRSNMRTIIGAFSKVVGCHWAFEAEVFAILHALIFCKNFSISHIVIESDSSLAVGWVNQRVHRPWKLINELHQIDAIIREVDCLCVSHIYREANSVANEYAKECCNLVVPLCELHHHPEELL